MNRSMMIPLITLLLSGTAYAAPLDEPIVTRTAADAVTVSWDKSNPVDVLLSANPAATIDEAKLVSKDDRDGTETVKVGAGERVYFLLKDRKSGEIVRVAERAVPLEQGSNFRDLGGYRAADSKHVKWGLIYRSGGQPMLTDTDVKNIQSLKIAHLVDLRSNEERVLVGLDVKPAG